MRAIPIVWNHLARRPGVAVLLAMLVSAGIGLADRFPPDPVEELRQALRVPTPDRNLRQRVLALRNLGDMRRALALQEWRPQAVGLFGETTASPDRQTHLLLVERFKKEARQMLRQSTANGRLAVMGMLAEMGPNIGSPDPEDQKGIA